MKTKLVSIIFGILGGLIIDYCTYRRAKKSNPDAEFEWYLVLERAFMGGSMGGAGSVALDLLPQEWL